MIKAIYIPQCKIVTALVSNIFNSAIKLPKKRKTESQKTSLTSLNSFRPRKAAEIVALNCKAVWK